MNPPWSQPMCQSCYVAKYGSPCKVLGNRRHVSEACAICGKDVTDGSDELRQGWIYVNLTGETWTAKKMGEWNKKQERNQSHSEPK